MPPSLADLETELQRRSMTRSFERFFRSFPPAQHYAYGKHTLGMMARIQKASEDYDRGISSYLAICVPFRHGKSDVSSRRLPAWHLLGHPDDEVALVAHSSDKAQELSHDARRTFRRAAPTWGLSVDSEIDNRRHWGVEGHKGAVHAIGIDAGSAGTTAHVLVIDDYYRNRQEAESEVIRARVWDGFGSDLMARLQPVHMVIIVANRWGPTDLIGSIIERNTPGTDNYDPFFPKFDIVKYPAQSESGDWLFPERFSPSWYEMQRASMGSYAWSAQAMQEPSPRSGNMFRSDLVEVVDSLPEGIRWNRGWDLASSEAQLIKDDPDYTVGTKAAWHDGYLYVADVRRGRWTALERNNRIKATAEQDGPQTTVWVETFGAYKDAYVAVKDALQGKAVVNRSMIKGDKVAKASVLEPLFESGKVRILRAPWNDAWLAEMAAFPGGAHDDQVDSLVIASDNALSTREGVAALPTAHNYSLAGFPLVVMKDEFADIREYDVNFVGFPHDLRRPGRLARAMVYSRLGPSACIWVHVDAEGAWTEFAALHWPGYLPIPDFCKAVFELSRDGRGKNHRYTIDLACSSLAGGPRDSDEVDKICAEFHRLALARDDDSSEMPDKFEPSRLGGDGGMDVIDALMRAAETGAPAVLVLSDGEVLAQLQAARMTPDKGASSGEQDGDVGRSGAYVTCLRMLALSWAG